MNDYINNLIRGNNIDKKQEIPYPDTKLNAPDTEPVTKQDIVPSEPEIPTPTDNTAEKLTAKTSPVTKDEIEGGENKEDVLSKFNDLNKRMDNLYNDEEEDEENASK